MVRPLFLQFPDDPQCQLEAVTFLNFPKCCSYMLQVKVEGEFMFGPDWLVVPITQPKVSQWKVYLPRWNCADNIHITCILILWLQLCWLLIQLSNWLPQRWHNFLRLGNGEAWRYEFNPSLVLRGGVLIFSSSLLGRVISDQMFPKCIGN